MQILKYMSYLHRPFLWMTYIFGLSLKLLKEFLSGDVLESIGPIQ